MIWFDLDNSPHVPLFRSVYAELEKREIPYVITSREFAQTEALLSLWNIKHFLIGKHGGKNKLSKIINLFIRTSQLKKFIKDKNAKLAVSHGSRTQVLTAYRLGIKSVLMLDYEYTETRIFNYFSDYLLMPECIPDSRLSSAGFNLKKIIRYKGLKEQLYLGTFVPDPEFRNKINAGNKQILVVLRPPGMTGSYHDERSEKLLLAAVSYVSRFDNVICLIVNRTEAEKNLILSNIKFKENIRFLEKAVDGLQLLYAADVAISGGGTMNRESALLGTPAYSIFTGRRPYVDEYLSAQGKLNFVENIHDIEKISIKKSKKDYNESFKNNLSLEITDIFLTLIPGTK